MNGDAPKMAMRDASWYRFPGRAWVYHVVISPPYVAACNASVMLVPETEVTVDAAGGMRCGRRACKSRWAAPGTETKETPAP